MIIPTKWELKRSLLSNFTLISLKELRSGRRCLPREQEKDVGEWNLLLFTVSLFIEHSICRVSRLDCKGAQTIGDETEALNLSKHGPMRIDGRLFIKK